LPTLPAPPGRVRLAPLATSTRIRRRGRYGRSRPGVRGTIRGAVAGEDTVAQELLWEGTHTGPMQTPQGILEPSGARISVEASLWARFEGDKAREVHHYLDVLTLLQQIGAMPGPPA
jgi:predicted ester cyclase